MAEPVTKDDLREAINEATERLITLMQASFARIDQRFDEMNARFENQARRLDRHGALIQTGSRWTGRMNGWSERVDSALEEKDLQIADLSERLRKLEEGRK